MSDSLDRSTCAIYETGTMASLQLGQLDFGNPLSPEISCFQIENARSNSPKNLPLSRGQNQLISSKIDE